MASTDDLSALTSAAHRAISWMTSGFLTRVIKLVILSVPTSAAHRSISWMTFGYLSAPTKLVMLSVPTSTVRWSISRMTTGWIYVSAIMFNPPRLRKSLIFPSSSPLSTRGPGG